MESMDERKLEESDSPAWGLGSDGVSLMPSLDGCSVDGGLAPPVNRGDDLPGYRLESYVDGFVETGTCRVPRVRTGWSLRDRLETGVVRLGIGRYRYTVVPGLYAVGNPDSRSEVLVTANFKLTFDHVRTSLDGVDLWILVLDTRGINVWCAAGKGTFATGELVGRIRAVNLADVVEHRRVIVPQLGATGVSARQVRSISGFRVVYGPVPASDIRAFLAANRTADPAMRRVTFTLYERMILTPVEVSGALKPMLITALVLFVLSGVGPGIFSFSRAWDRGVTAWSALVLGLLSGAVLTPILLPLIPVREFALKGILAGIPAAGLLLWAAPAARASLGAGLALVLLVAAASSVLAMNFTGATPFTAPSGVEKEMKRYIPVQTAALGMAAGLWIWSVF